MSAKSPELTVDKADLDAMREELLRERAHVQSARRAEEGARNEARRIG
jgi:hypothetical protein